MKISIASNHPPADELLQVLNDTFGPRYSFRLFGLGKEKTIMARKSALVGLQLSFTDKQANFQRTTPTIAGSALSFMMLTEFAVLLILPLLIILKVLRKIRTKKWQKKSDFFSRRNFHHASPNDLMLNFNGFALNPNSDKECDGR